MIYTCTLNPSLDYYLEFDKPIELGKLNRSNLEYYEAGGKGINVSIVLNNMLIPSKALGFLAGFTRDFYLQLLQKYEYIQPNFITVEGYTRVNVKIKSEIETELNAKGPFISQENMNQLKKKLDRMDEDDIFILSGNVPEYLEADIVDFLRECHENKIKFVLDTNTQIYLDGVQYEPLLVKPNLQELETMFDCKIESREDIIDKAKKLHEMGAQNVIVSMGDQGSIMVNQDGCYHANTIQDEIVSTTGAGDSMVAGFVMSTLRSRNLVEAFKYANCCGCATTFSKGLATREKIDHYYEQINVQKLDSSL